ESSPSSSTSSRQVEPDAQRLSASLESSPNKCANRSALILVLNAFRHHWNLHHPSRGDQAARLPVLNAFRHHWNLHQRLRKLSRKTLVCAQRLSASLESS